ncbi:MAG: helix-turn-helix transcriptional regulator [bacterium]|nr:helix-turn-helix transcriptional regulator [bacterium]
MYGPKLKKLIKAKGFSQKKIAEITGTPETTVSNWTKIEFPPLEAIKKICVILEVPIWEFFFEPGEAWGVSEESLEMTKQVDSLPEAKKEEVLRQVEGLIKLARG